MIRSRRDIRAPSHVVHELITDVETWCLWSPHVAAVDPPTGRLAAGWSGEVRAWFAPPTTMTVIWAEPGRGMGWETPVLGHVLVYDQRIEPGENGCRVTFEARVEGPVGEWITRLAAPLSSLGQRRRLARLGLLAEWHARQQPSPY